MLQTDSTAIASFEDAAADVLPASRTPRKTVFRVIEQLGWNSTPEQRDSAVQANFPDRHMVWEKWAQPYLPLGKPEKNPAADLRHRFGAYKSPLLRKLPVEIQEVPYHPKGIAGDPVPYLFRTDDFVTSALMLSFFLVVWVIARSWHFLGASLKNFFFESRKRDNLFTSRTDRELNGQIFLVFQTCFLLGIFFFGYTQDHLTEVFNQISPYVILSIAAGACVAFYAVKMVLYKLVNTVFFEDWQTDLWRDIYLLYILILGLLLLPAALLFVFFDLSFTHLSLYFLSVVGITKLLLLYKCSRIFFDYRGGLLHLFLYFCTLELVPTLVLWRALVYVNNGLTTAY